MTATNINIEEFIQALEGLKAKGHSLIDLDMIPDDNIPNMNKLVIHPVKTPESTQRETIDETPKKDVIKNPKIDRSNNDIFNNYNGYFGL